MSRQHRLVGGELAPPLQNHRLHGLEKLAIQALGFGCRLDAQVGPEQLPAAVIVGDGAVALAETRQADH